MAALESALVALIVLACTVFSLWRLLSARLRLRLLDRLPGALGRSEAGWRGRIRRKALAELAGGCGACARAPRAPRAPLAPTAVAPPANRTPAAPPR